MAHPTSNHDPLYRIMREESELAVRRNHHRREEGGPRGSGDRGHGGEGGGYERVRGGRGRGGGGAGGAGTFESSAQLGQGGAAAPATSSMQQQSLKAAAVYDSQARRLLQEQAARSTRMVLSSDLSALRTFSTVDPDMWVQLRAVYFLLVSYHELVASRAVFLAQVQGGMAKGSDSGGGGGESLPPLQHKTPELSDPHADAPGDQEFFQSVSSSVNMGLLWDRLAGQRLELEVGAATVAEKFSWPMLRALLDLPDEFSCALVYIERGETQFDDQVRSLCYLCYTILHADRPVYKYIYYIYIFIYIGHPMRR